MMRAAPLLLALLCCLVGQTWAAASYPPIPKDKKTPVQQRIALYGPRGEHAASLILLSRADLSRFTRFMHTLAAMSVGWNTYEKQSQPCVDYGLSPGKLTMSSCSDSSITYPTSRTWSNSVILNNLKPATKYFYKIRSTNSSTDFFQSGRVAGDKTPFTLNTIIDLGVYGEDGYTLPHDDKSKRDEIPKIQPALNHTTIGALAKTIDDYELILHPG